MNAFDCEVEQNRDAYAALLERVRELERENAMLRERLGIPAAPASCIEETRGSEPQTTRSPSLSELTRAAAQARSDAFDKYRPPEEKIALFRSLFQGREDVFARRWQSAKTGKSGYSPACANEWETGVCPKPNGNCAHCEKRELIPLSDAVINRHLRGRDPLGRDVVGVYPILPDDLCRFLALDFDDEGWQTEAAVVRSVCESWSLPCAVERSRSGNGAHLWLFFSEAVPCADARRLGTALLTAAMESGGGLKLSAYDRMFPNQDTLPKGGFGNLIALPLQGLARRQGNSVFVDKEWVPVADQWAFLASIPSITSGELEGLLQAHCRGDALGTLMQSDETPKPWEKCKPVQLKPSDFGTELEIIQNNLLYLKENELSARAKNRLVRLAAFRNPEFYRAQAMRLPIYNKPRVISTAELREGYLALPRGCVEPLRALLDEADVPYRLTDRREAGRLIRVSFNGMLREEQIAAAEALLRSDTGVLAAATAFGKTVLSAYLIAERKVNTLVLVHTQALLNQWKDSLGEFLTIDETLPEVPKQRGRKKKLSLIGQLGGTKNTLSGIIDVAIIQSLLNGDEVKDLVKHYGMVIVDECHHVSAVTFERVMKEVCARYVYGLSATPTRQDGHHPIVFMQCGPIRYQVDAKEQAGKHSFSHFVIPRFTSYRTATAEERGIAALYSDLAEDERRNALIVKDVREALSEGRSPILLTERREHVERLAALLKADCRNVVTLFGAASEKQRREAMERLCSVQAKDPLLVIATGKYVGEGFDCPRLDTLLLTMPVAWKGTVAQYAGRLHRSYQGKTEVRIYDYVDVRVPVLEKMYQKRLKAYAAIGYHIRADVQLPQERDLIYDGRSFYPIYCQDLAAAQKEILIVSPFMRRSRLEKLIKVLSGPLLNGVTVKVITRPAEDLPARDRNGVEENGEYLTGYGIHVVWRSGFHQKFTVIDGTLAWYGSVNFLSFGAAEESIMRLESPEIAGVLMDSVAGS